jgi:hypothetical protein
MIGRIEEDAASPLPRKAVICGGIKRLGPDRGLRLLVGRWVEVDLAQDRARELDIFRRRIKFETRRSLRCRGPRRSSPARRCAGGDGARPRGARSNAM